MARPPRPPSSPPLSSPQLKLQRQESTSEDDGLFNPPPDLTCPITHEIFSDPVINAAGQVYERASIDRHLARHNTDPITGMRLNSKVLTPVYFLKSRAAEFREAAARRCVEKASTLGTQDAVRFVRRAAELCEALDSTVPCLSKECMAYIRGHPSNVYDGAIMHLFAHGLLQTGQRHKAAAVYFTLLQSGADKAQQADLLKHHLSCWNFGEGQSSTKDKVEMLVDFVEQSEGPSAAQIVEIAQEAKLEHEFITTFCEHYLSGSSALTAQEWVKQKDVFLKYVQICCTYISAQQRRVDERMEKAKEVEQELRSLIGGQSERPSPVVSQPAVKKGTKAQLGAAACLVATSLANPAILGVQVVKAASILALVHFSKH